MTPVTPDQFKTMMLTGGTIADVSVSQDVDCMSMQFSNPFTIQGCQLKSLRFNDCPLNSIAFTGATSVASIVLAGANTNFQAFNTDASVTVSAISFSDMGNAGTVTIGCNVDTVSLTNCSIQTLNLLTGQCGTLSFSQGVYFNALTLNGAFSTVNIGFTTGSQAVIQNSQITQMNVMATTIPAYQFADSLVESLNFDPASFKAARQMQFQDTTILNMAITGQPASYSNLTMTLTGS